MADDKVILKAEDLDGYLTEQDLNELQKLEDMYSQAMTNFSPLNIENTISAYDKIGKEMQKICSQHPSIQVCSCRSKPCNCKTP